MFVAVFMVLLVPSRALGTGLGIFGGLVAAWLILLAHGRAQRRQLAAMQAEIVSLDGLLAHEANDRRLPGDEEPPPRSPPRDLEELRDRLADRGVDLARRAGQVRGELETLRGIVAAVDIPVFATSASGIVVLCNPAFERLLHRQSETVVGLPIEEILPQTSVLELHEHAQSGSPDQAQVSVRTPSGERVFQVSAVPGRGARPWGVVVAMRDITELAQAMRLKTDFVANASHELRTPIASIRAAAETLATAADDPPMVHRVTKMIAGSVQRLEEMIADLLDLSRLEQPDLKPACEEVNLAEVIESIASMSEKVCEERALRIEQDIHPSFAHFRTDPHLINLILRNLIDNATKFAHENTTIRIVARPAPAPASPQGDGAQREEIDPECRGFVGARIDVIDRGIGIPLKLQQRVFERFYQVDPSRTRQQTRRGTGLGLAIVKHAARQLGGDITVQSVWQEGTTMSVHLPACLPPDADGATAGRTAASDAQAS